MKKEMPFKVSARTAKLIWKENFANANWAIIELVKNSYDADANDSLIIFCNGILYIVDNWIWMNEDIIAENWMKIWTDNKKLDYETSTNRIKSWAKGIGRFALDRLSSISEMYTVDKETKKWIYWKVDWSSFDTADSISEIKAEIEDFNNFNLKDFLLLELKWYDKIINKIKNINIENWTILKLTNLRDVWNFKNLDSLFSNLEILTPPFSNHTFSIFLFDSNNEWLYWKVNTANYDDYDYEIHAYYLWDKDYNIEVQITRNELDLDKIEKNYSEIFEMDQMKKDFFDLKSLKNKTFKTKFSLLDFKWFSNVDKDLLDNVWKFDFSFYFIKNRHSDNKDETDVTIYPYKDVNYANRSAWISKFWWVRIFRDNFRVRPYWENWDDWLQLWERQAQSPQWAWQRLWTYRIRPNQISWVINISRIYNLYFEDKSGREWIQENEVFELFKNIILQIIGLFEKDRNIIMNSLNKLADIRNEKQRKKREAEEALRIIEEKKNNNKENQPSKACWNNNEQPPTKEELALVEWNKVLENELEEKDREIMMLRGLASVWLIISSFSHELKNIKNSIVARNEALLEAMEKFIWKDKVNWIYKYDNPFYLLEQIKEDDLRIQHWLEYSLSSLKRDKRERKNIDIVWYFEWFRDMWLIALKQKNIELKLDLPKEKDKYILKCFTIDLDTIFNNLLSNSVDALKNNPKWQGKIISISIVPLDESYIKIIFADNWTWLLGDFAKNPSDIFIAHETSKIDVHWNKIWTGLWMYIVSNIIKEYTGASINIDDYIDKFVISTNFKLL